jgi:ribosomal protein S12 methylthiotransferase accessory factor
MGRPVPRLRPPHHGVGVPVGLVESLLRHSIVASLERIPVLPDEPQAFFYESTGASGEETYRGRGFDISPDLARLKALGEAVERCSVGLRRKGLPLISYAHQIERTEDPVLWMDQEEAQDPLKRRRARKSPRSWWPAVDLSIRKRTRVPAEVVLVPFDPDGGTPLRTPITTGTAFGQSPEDAGMRGLLECIERDAFLLAYRKKVAPVRVCHPYLDELRGYFARYRLRLDVYRLPCDFSAGVFMASVRDETRLGPAVSLGVKADIDPLRGAVGAVWEAQFVRCWLRDFYRIHPRPRRLRPKELSSALLRGAYWWSRANLGRLEFMLEPAGNEPLSAMPARPATFSSLVREVLDRGCRVFLADVSLGRAPGIVTKVLIPEFQPVDPLETTRPFISRRLQERGVHGLNRNPSPFA